MNNRELRLVFLTAVAVASACAKEKDTARLVIQTVSDYSGAPMAGVQVQVNDQPWATTAADGRASFDPVSGPYTLRIHQAYGNATGTSLSSKVWVLPGKSGDAVVLVDGSPAAWRRSNLSGTVTGRASTSSTVTLVAGPSAAPALVAADGAFSCTARWQGATSQSLTARALEWDGAQPPAHYMGFGSAAVPVSDGGSVSGAAVALQAVSEGTVSGTVSVPASLSSNASLAWYTDFLLLFSDYEGMILPAGAAPPASPTWTLPRVAGASTWVSVVAAPPPGTAPPSPYPSSGHVRLVTVPSSGVAFDLPAPVELVAPADGATIDGTTVFQWSAAGGAGTYRLRMSCSWTAGGVNHVVSFRALETTGTQATLPSIPGLSLASGATCIWSVMWHAAADPAVESRYSTSVERSATVL